VLLALYFHAGSFSHDVDRVSATTVEFAAGRAVAFVERVRRFGLAAEFYLAAMA
jgi:hypothetical protein